MFGSMWGYINEGIHHLYTQYLLWRFHSSRICCRPPSPEIRKDLFSDFICAELAIHAGTGLKSWLRGFPLLFAPPQNSKGLKKSASNCDPKLSKPADNRKSLCLISLLCVLCKILERLIYAHINLSVTFLLRQEQAGF